MAKILSPMQLMLLTIAEVERSGRDIAKLYKGETGKDISYGTLYTTLSRMRKRGWVRVRDDEDGDGRVRFFRITGSGRRALNRTREHYARIATFGTQGAAPA